MTGAVSASSVRRALDRELPAIPFDEEMVAYLAGSLEGVEASVDDVAEAWSPILLAMSAASDDEAAREVCGGILRRLRSDDGSTTASDHPVAELCTGGGSPAKSKPASHQQPVGDRIRQRKAEQESQPPADRPTPGGQVVARPADECEEACKGLREWLERLRLTQYRERARAWCDQMGAADIDEVAECWEDFCKELALKPLERKRVQKDFESRQETAQSLAPPGSTSPASPADGLADPARKWLPSDIDPLPPAAQPAPAVNIHEGRETFGDPDHPYTLLEELGAGATATVYKAVRREEDRIQEYAVKVISLTKIRRLGERHFERVSEKLHRETGILFQLRSKHIVSLFDVVETSEKLYLVMELVEGGELFEHILRNGCLSESEARYVFLQLAISLKYIHGEGVVHRDLKPENILVDEKESRKGFLEVKISDFGHSKLIDDGYSTALTRVGTPQYWAPEVSDSMTCAKGYDEKVDLWSLGVVLYVMLEGTYPFDGIDTRIEDQIRKAEIQWKHPSRPSREAREIIGGLIQVRPKDRLPLEACLEHPWVTRGGALSKVMKACEDSRESGDVREEHVPLPSDPRDYRELRRDLQFFTNKFKTAASLRKREVVVSWAESPAAGRPCRAREQEATRSELMGILEHHFPGHFQNGSQAVVRHGYPLRGGTTQDATVGAPLAPVREEQLLVTRSGRCSQEQRGGATCSSKRAAATGDKFRIFRHKLRVIGEDGAGLDLAPERGGMRVVEIFDAPGQPGLQKGDLIVKINDVSLGKSDHVNEVFGQHFAHDAVLSVQRRRAG